MTTQPSVLACIDGSAMSEAVCDYAAWIAHTVDAPLKLLHTIEQSSQPMLSDYSGAIGLGSQQELLEELTELEQNRSRLLIKQGQVMLGAAKQRAEQRGLTDLVTVQRHGSLSETLIALEDNLRVLVLGIRGISHDNDRTGLGAQLESIIRSLHQPIFVVNRSFEQPKSVMLAYDGSDACRKAVDMVATSPLFKAVSVHLVHVGEKTASCLAEAQQKLAEANLDLITNKLTGKLDEALIEYQKNHAIDFIMMGAFSHHRIRDFLVGSFTAKMLERTQQPLLLLR